MSKIKSRTSKVGAPPIIGGLLGGKGYYRTKITDGHKTRTGAGSTPEKAERNASRRGPLRKVDLWDGPRASLGAALSSDLCG